MARRRLLLLASLLALSAGCLRARGTPEEPIVTDFEIQGTRALDAGDILAVLATQKSGAFFWQDKSRLDPDAVAVDRRRIEAYYRDHGYYDARVKDVRLDPKGRGRVKVVMVVEEGEPVRVTAVEVKGLEDLPEAAGALPKLRLEVGEVFTVGEYDGAKGAIVGALRNDGWATAEVTQEARVFPAEHAAEVTYVVRPGQRFRFGPVFVAGTATVPRDRIRDQALIELKPGQWYSESKLGRAQARVFDLGVFGGVRVTRGTPDAQRGIIPVVVAVREAPFRTIRTGPGFGVEGNNRLDVNGTVGWTNRNFIGDLRRLKLDLRAGYAWILAQSGKDGPVGLASAEFSQPGAISRRIDAAARLEVERGLEAAYDFWSERVRISFPVRLTRRFTFVPSYNVEVYQLSNAPPDDPTAPDLLQNCPGTVCLLSYLEQQIGWDLRDDPVNTRRGLYVFLSVQEAFNLGGYGYRYLRVVPEARAFFPLGERFVLALRTRVGALTPVAATERPPIVARFYAGGAQSQRGYYTNRLSPMVFRDGDWLPVGGNGLADGSLELRFGITGNIGGAVFLDGGNVARPSAVPTEWRTVLDPTQLQWATGFGVRYRTPFGPVRLDVGFQVPTNWASDVRFPNRFPTIPSVIDPPAGGDAEHREPWRAFHLSIGEAF